MPDSQSIIQNVSEGPRSAALSYHLLGWEPLALPAHEKRPKGPWKEPRNWTEAKIRQAFGPVNNVGIALGDRSGGLIDLDFDCPEAATLGRILFRDLPRFGRKSSPYSHRIAYSTVSKTRVPFQLPKELVGASGAERKMILEVRGNKHQTMVPPSVHPGGETVAWHDDPQAAPELEAGDLLTRAGLAASLSVVAMYYPRVAGDRDEIAMMLAGVLVRAGLDDDVIDDLIECVATLGCDEEAEKRRGKSTATRASLDAGESAWGLPELCSRLGIEAAEPTIRKWLGYAVSTAAPAGSGRLVIFVSGGNLPAEVDAAEETLLAANLGVYQRGENLVRVVRLPQSEGDDGVQRPSGALLIHPVNPAWLREKFALSAVWMRQGKEEAYPINPPTEHARAFGAGW